MRRIKRPNKIEFYEIYYENKIPVKEIAKKYKVKPQTVYNWAQYYKNINKPTKLSVKQIFYRYHANKQ